MKFKFNGMTILFTAQLILSLFSLSASADPSQTVKWKPVNDLSQIDGRWTQTGIACVDPATGLLYDYRDSNEVSNRLKIFADKKYFEETRQMVEWVRNLKNKSCENFMGSGSIEVVNSNLTLKLSFKVEERINEETGKTCNMKGQFEDEYPFLLYKIDEEQIAFRYSAHSIYYGCETKHNGSVPITFWQRPSLL